MKRQDITDEPAGDPKSRARRRWRILAGVCAWLVMFAWSNIPPYRGNVLEQKRDFFVWHWKLYNRGGEGICDVRYFDMKNDGAPIERWKLLGFERPGEMPDKIGRTHKKQLYREYRRVCWAMHKSGVVQPHVEVEARCAAHGEWKPVENRRRNVCTIRKNKSKAKAGRSKT